jgi:anti-sigma regulatory factor (Ser/Thr protein kinase)
MSIELRLAPGPRAPSEARRSLDGLQEVDPDLLGQLRLLVSELVTNSVRHARLRQQEDIRLRVDPAPDVVRVEVVDEGKGFMPADPAPEPDRAFGWGLYLVDRVADRWGVVVDGQTLVWFEIDRG